MKIHCRRRSGGEKLLWEGTKEIMFYVALNFPVYESKNVCLRLQMFHFCLEGLRTDNNMLMSHGSLRYFLRRTEKVMDCLRGEVYVFSDNLNATKQVNVKNCSLNNDLLAVQWQPIHLSLIEKQTRCDGFEKNTLGQKLSQRSISKHFSNLHNISLFQILIYSLTEKRIARNEIFTIQLLIVMSCRKQRRELNHVGNDHKLFFNWKEEKI